MSYTSGSQYEGVVRFMGNPDHEQMISSQGPNKTAFAVATLLTEQALGRRPAQLR